MKFHHASSLLLLGSGLLFIGMSLPLLFNKIKMNHWYGVRIPKSFKSDDHWYKINHYGAKCLIWWSIVPLLAGLGNLVYPYLTIDRAFLLALIVMVPVFAALIQILVYSSKL